MDDHIYKRHNKTLLLYHLVFPLKYRKKILTEETGESLKSVCVELSGRYELEFIEIEYASDHVHFLVQSVPSISINKLVRVIKSITARELFRLHPEIKQLLWGGSLWTSGYYANTVGQYGTGGYKKVCGESRERERIKENPFRTARFVLILRGLPRGSLLILKK